MASQYERKDHLYKKAKSEGLRSRANYKLQEINQKYKLFKHGSKVMDLGAWPGGWLQYILSCIGPNGKAVGIDLKEIEDLSDPRLLFITGDVTNEASIAKAIEFMGSELDVVVSDMSPKLSGIQEADQARATSLAETALSVAEKSLKKGGHFVCKIFKGGDSDSFVKTIKTKFDKLQRAELESTRKTSNEYYIIGLGIIK